MQKNVSAHIILEFIILISLKNSIYENTSAASRHYA